MAKSCTYESYSQAHQCFPKHSCLFLELHICSILTNQSWWVRLHYLFNFM